MATEQAGVWCRRSHEYTWPEQALGCGAVFHMTSREGENRELGCHPSATLKPGKSHLDTALDDLFFQENWAARPVLRLVV